MKIVTKKDNNGLAVEFTLGERGQVWCRYLAHRMRWPADDQTASLCGTTLPALRAELTEEGGE
jgi:hypothetical protein